MGKNFNESEVFINEEVEFSIDDKDYFWVGSYEVASHGEESDWDYVGDNETVVNILGTHQLCTWDEEQGKTISIAPTGEILDAIVDTIFNKL